MILTRSRPESSGSRLVLRVALVAMATLAAAALLAPAEVAAQPPASVPLQTTAVDLRIEDASGEARRYRLLTTTDGAPRRLRQGSRVPIPVTRGAADGEGPRTTYQYQDIGFDAEVRVSAQGDGTFRLQARLEDSLVGSAPSPSVPPVVEHHTQDLNVLLRPETPMVVTDLRGDGSSYRVEVVLRGGTGDA